MTQDHLSIEVVDVQLREYVNILLNHPQKHFWLVTLMPQDTHARGFAGGSIIFCVCRCEEVAYVFIGKPVPQWTPDLCRRPCPKRFL